MENLNHKIIAEHLINIGFYQPIASRHGCWVNADGVVLYYAANNREYPVYVVCHKLNRYEFTEISELNSILVVIGGKIKKTNHEIIHRYAAENARN